MSVPRLSLIIPCYNEARNLPLLVPRCQELSKSGDIEVILVDNGSTDDSPARLKELLANASRCRSIRVPVNQGYGYGIVFGLRAAKAPLLGWTHADMQTDPGDARRGLALFDRFGDDLFVKGRRIGRPLGDVAFTVGMSVFESMLLRRPLWDINAQPTMFSRKFFEAWPEPPGDFSLDLFAYYHARRRSVNIHRFPVRFGERAHGMSHWNVNWSAKKKFIRRTVAFSLELRRAERA